MNERSQRRETTSSQPSRSCSTKRDDVSATAPGRGLMRQMQAALTTKLPASIAIALPGPNSAISAPARAEPSTSPTACDIARARHAVADHAADQRERRQRHPLRGQHQPEARRRARQLEHGERERDREQRVADDRDRAAAEQQREVAVAESGGAQAVVAATGGDTASTNDSCSSAPVSSNTRSTALGPWMNSTRQPRSAPSLLNSSSARRPRQSMNETRRRSIVTASARCHTPCSARVSWSTVARSTSPSTANTAPLSKSRNSNTLRNGFSGSTDPYLVVAGFLMKPAAPPTLQEGNGGAARFAGDQFAEIAWFPRKSPVGSTSALTRRRRA